MKPPKAIPVVIGSLFVLTAVLCSAQSNITAPGIRQSPDALGSENVKTKPSGVPPAKPTDAGKQDTGKRYVIGPLDVLSVKVWNQPQLSGFVDVLPDGMISMSLIGEVKADGLTAGQLRDVLTKRLNEFLNNPEVEVQVTKVNSKRYFVYGGVLRPGEFPLVGATTIMDALSMIGGFRDFAKPNKIRIQRGNQTFYFNYNDFSKGRNMAKNPNIELQNGDRIYVPE